MERVAVAIVTGVSVLGFVAFFGGAVLFTRFYSAGVPAEEAIAHVPRTNLISSGAVFLVPAILTSLAAVTAMSVLDRLFGHFSSRQEAGVALVAREQSLTERAAAQDAALVAVTAERTTVERLGETPVAVWPSTHAWEQAREAAAQRLQQAEQSRQDAIHATGQAEADQAVAARALENAEHRFWRRATGCAALLIGEIIIIAPALDVLKSAGDWFLVVTAIALTIAGSIVVGVRTRGFTWFALTSFIAVGLFMGIATYERTKNDTKVEPVALLHDGNIPAYGFFVAATDKHVYIAQPQRKVHATELKLADSDNRLLEFDRSKVTNLQVGPLIRSEPAYRRSLELAAGICRVPNTAPKAAETSAKPAKGKKKGAKKKRVTKKPRAAAARTRPTAICDPARAAALRSELAAVRHVDTDRKEG